MLIIVSFGAWKYQGDNVDFEDHVNTSSPHSVSIKYILYSVVFQHNMRSVNVFTEVTSSLR